MIDWNETELKTGFPKSYFDKYPKSDRKVCRICDDCGDIKWLSIRSSGGGDRCHKCANRTQESRDKRSKSATIRWSSQDERDKQAERTTGHVKSESTLLKMRNNMVDRYKDVEEIDKQRNRMLGNKNPFYGKHHTDEVKQILRKATSSRKNLTRDTSIEIKMQNILRAHGYFFKTQVQICDICIPDIVLPERQIIIQCDGDYWHNLSHVADRDQYQDKILTENGWRVIRFWEHEINKNIQDCLRKFEAIYHNIEYKPFYVQGTLNEWM